MIDVRELSARLTALELAQKQRTVAASMLSGLSTAQRMVLQAARNAYTPGDLLPYPNDYNDPADSPAAFQGLAEATQTALNKRAQVGLVNYLTATTYPMQHSTWQPYIEITDVESFNRHGNWAQLPARSAYPGIWRITCVSYCDVTGGSSSEQAMGCGIAGAWHDGTAFAWAGAGLATIGRVTAPKAARIVVAQVSEGYVVNIPQKALRIAPAATLYGSKAAGSVSKLGLSRITAEWLANVSQITGMTYPL